MIHHPTTLHMCLPPAAPEDSEEFRPSHRLAGRQGPKTQKKCYKVQRREESTMSGQPALGDFDSQDIQCSTNW